MSVKQKNPTPLVLNEQYQKWIEYQPISNEKYVPVLYYISSLEHNIF